MASEPVTGSSTVIPVLVYADIAAAHDFLVTVFAFESGGVHYTADGTAVHAEVRMGGSPIWLHAVVPESEMASPRDSRDSHGGLEVIVDDVDAHFAHSRDSGALIDRPPSDQPYGLREYGARDLENHRWYFSSPVPT
jgi:MerR family transcriptional regulator, thiopeptide resistance regulator